MRNVLKASGISKEETAANPQAVLDILSFHMEGGSEAVSPPPPPPPPKQLQNEKIVTAQITEAANIINADYKDKFSGLKKLGEGAGGIVYSAIDNETKNKVAIKIAPITELKHLINEMGLQSLSKHPNIVQYNKVLNISALSIDFPYTFHMIY
jgi:serine/threonine protein kinase